MQTRVEVNKGQILALLGRETFSRATHAGHPIQLFVRASIDEEARINVRYRVELSQAAARGMQFPSQSARIRERPLQSARRACAFFFRFYGGEPC
jgi:hypothetical protein